MNSQLCEGLLDIYIFSRYDSSAMGSLILKFYNETEDDILTTMLVTSY